MVPLKSESGDYYQPYVIHYMVPQLSALFITGTAQITIKLKTYSHSFMNIYIRVNLSMVPKVKQRPSIGAVGRVHGPSVRWCMAPQAKIWLRWRCSRTHIFAYGAKRYHNICRKVSFEGTIGGLILFRFTC